MQLNKAPCFNKSGFGELQREYLIYFSEICRNKSIENFIYLQSVNLLIFNSSFVKMDTKRKSCYFYLSNNFYEEKKKIRMRFYLLLSNCLRRKIELQRTEISLLSPSLFLNSTTGKAKRGI